MIEMTSIFSLIIILILLAVIYNFLLKKMESKKLFIIGLIFALIPLVYFFILIILHESLMFCSLIPSSFASFKPLFLRNSIGTLIGLFPWLGGLSFNNPF